MDAGKTERKKMGVGREIEKKRLTSFLLFAFQVAIWSLLDMVRWMAFTMTLLRVADVGDCAFPLADSSSR